MNTSTLFALALVLLMAVVSQYGGGVEAGRKIIFNVGNKKKDNHGYGHEEGHGYGHEKKKKTGPVAIIKKGKMIIYFSFSII